MHVHIHVHVRMSYSAPVAQSVSARYLYSSIQQSNAEVVSSSLTWSNLYHHWVMRYKFILHTIVQSSTKRLSKWNVMYSLLVMWHEVLMHLHSIMHNAFNIFLLSTISLLPFIVKNEWPWRDLNTQPSDLESDALPLRHKATMYNIIWPPITWHCLNTGALVIYCRCECMCKPMKPYSESTVFRPYSFWMYNPALKLPVHVCKTEFLECTCTFTCMCACPTVLQWRNRSARGTYTAVSSRAMPRLWVQASPGANFIFIE